VQVTSGNRRIDYYLGSELVEPENAAEHYTECLILSPTLLTYQIPPSLPSPLKTRDDFGFSARQHLYVCAQQPGKFHPDFDQLLGNILRADGHGVVVAVSDRHGYAAEIVRARLRETVPDVVDRVVFLPRLDFDDYLQLLNVADVLLDPPHFGGVNSTYDALAIGKPIVTLPSDYHRGRYTAACLRQTGITDTIVRTRDDYVKVAVDLATDRDRREALMETLGKASAALFRDDGAVNEHARIFTQLLEEAEKRVGS
jgi:predicted O-linked N-acetylglucosamine transferase (SPINDLY family)